jgi:hypothetical protein
MNPFFSFSKRKTKKVGTFVWVLYMNRKSNFNSDIPLAMIFDTKPKAMKYYEMNKDYCESYRTKSGDWTNLPERKIIN